MHSISFSIIVALYNKEATIGRTITSVLGQSYGDFELIVIDDGSQDHSCDVVRSFTDDRLRYYYKSNGGVSSARNYGASKARNEWLLFLDADDELMDDALVRFKTLTVQYPKCKMLVGATEWIQNGRHVNDRLDHKQQSGSTKYPFWATWMRHFFLATGNVCVSRQLLAAHGMHDERMSFFEDTEFYWRIMAHCSVAYTNALIRIYHQDNGGLSSSAHSMTKDMVYYLPEFKATSIWQKAMWYEILAFVQMCHDSAHDEAASAYYKKMERQNFSWVYRALHGIRQRLINHHVI